MYESDASYLDSCTGISLQGPLLGFNSEINPRANRKGIRAHWDASNHLLIFVPNFSLSFPSQKSSFRLQPKGILHRYGRSIIKRILLYS